MAAGGVGSSVGGAAGDNGNRGGGGAYGGRTGGLFGGSVSGVGLGGNQSYSWDPNKPGSVSSNGTTVTGGWSITNSTANSSNGGANGGGGGNGGSGSNPYSSMSASDLANAIRVAQANEKRTSGYLKAGYTAQLNQLNQALNAKNQVYNNAQQQQQQAPQQQQQQQQQQAPQVDQAAQQRAAAEAQQRAAAEAQQRAAAEAAQRAAAEAAARAAEQARLKAEAGQQETARAERAKLLTEQLRVNTQRAASDPSAYRQQAAKAAVNAITGELQQLSNQSASYMQQWQPDQFKTIQEVQQGGMITAADGTKIDASTKAANDAMAFSDAQHPSVMSVLASMGVGALKGFLSGGPVGALAGAVVNGISTSGAMSGVSLQGQNPNVNGKTAGGYGPGQTLANGQVVGNGNGGRDATGTSGWRPEQQGQVNPLAPGYDASGSTGNTSGSWTIGPQQANEQAYNQYLGLLAQREKANSLTTNAGWMGGSGSSLLGRWAATQGGRGGASGTEYSPLATAPKSLYG